MDGDLIVGDASPEQLGPVAQLLMVSYAEHARHFPPAMWRAYEREIAAVRARAAVAEVIVARRARQLLGTVAFYPPASAGRHGWPSGVAELRLLAVRPAARGQGVGRVLVEECLARARAHGASAVGLHTAWFMASATHLYEGMGFQRLPEHDFDAGRRYGPGTGSTAEPAAASACTAVRGLAYVMRL